MNPQQKRQGVSEYGQKKDIRDRVASLEQESRHLATREWVLGLVLKVGLGLFASVVAVGIFVWRTITLA